MLLRLKIRQPSQVLRSGDCINKHPLPSIEQLLVLIGKIKNIEMKSWVFDLITCYHFILKSPKLAVDCLSPGQYEGLLTRKLPLKFE